MEAVIPYIEHSRIESRCDEIIRTLPIASDYNIIFIVEGSRRFADALVSRIGHGATLIPVRIHTYAGTSSTSRPRLNNADLLKLKMADYRKPTLLVDDICDSGNTLCSVQSLVPKDVTTIVLLDKPGNHTCDVRLDRIGFEVPGSMFFVGYGMDYNGRYRGLDYIGILSGKPRM